MVTWGGVFQGLMGLLAFDGVGLVLYSACESETVRARHQSKPPYSTQRVTLCDVFRYSRADSRANLLNTPSTVWRSPRTPPAYSTFRPSPTGLAAAVVLAFKQRIWTTVRSKLLSVTALDSLFAATEDLSALHNLEVYKKAKVAMLLAAFAWLTLVVIILTSNTLTVQLALSIENTTCSGIRTLNSTKEEIEVIKPPRMSIWNMTASDTASSDWFDYYTAPSNPLNRVATYVAYMGHPVSKSDTSVHIRGSGWNCTYVINFTAPGYKCSKLASGIRSEVKMLGDQKPPDGLSTKLLIPSRDYSYYAYTSGGEYSPQMRDTSPGGIPNVEPPFPNTSGVFRTEPVIWIGYSVRTKPNEIAPLNRSMAGWSDAFVPKVIGCEHYETSYTVLFNLSGGEQVTNVIERKYLRRIDANDGTNGNTTAQPKSNYIYPKDARHCRRAAAFHAIGTQLRQFENGTMNSTQLNNPIEATKADQTKLLNPRQDWFAFPTLDNLVQEFYEDMILSLFSNPQRGRRACRYPCVRSRLENRYDYHVRDLWIVYSIAILLATAGVGSGTLAILENEGVLRSTRFSSILGWLGEDRGDLPSDIRNLGVGYGIVYGMGSFRDLHENMRYPEARVWDGGNVHYGFGLEGDARQLRTEGGVF
ncbi:hypothetical protein F5Y11DRAFT_355544 [Daldinia sp. FL1419]|nr:hypothetical protein F5Y11DRAFT_355544 [Daldinia sp. FL1419]